MHTLTIQTKFTFGDRVRFDSRLQRCSGSGVIYAITVDAERHVDYLVANGSTEYTEFQAGIQEDEITLLDDGDVIA